MGNLLSHDRPSQRKRKREEESAEGASTSSSKRAKEESTEGASTSSSISPEATGVGSGQHDVFLSFSGSDTRKEFTDHLYHNLELAGIRVFKDDKSIPFGERFDTCIINAITQSKIFIPIISENYASRKWCLLELACMMNCKENSSDMILPIFYKVSPSDVKDLKGKFGQAFHLSLKHFDENASQKVRKALEEVGKLEGWESTKFANGHEGALVKSVVKIVRSKLQENIPLDVPENIVGMDDDLKKIVNWIDSPSTNARMIGIYGMGGIGKTTLAKCIVNRCLNKFEHVSFLLDVRETVRRQSIAHLQKQLIWDILKYDIEITTCDEEINTLKSRIKGKKVFIVLDDVDEDKQLDALAREPDWFGKGSVIIVTTRNKDVLDQSKFKVDFIHGLNGLNREQSLLLFNIHAFRVSHSPPDFEDISHDIISTMDGLPLALKVVGSSLYSKTDRKIWEDMLGKLKSQPHGDVIKILRISYDALEEEEYKQIFVDIACFFIGENRELPMYMWEGCGFYPSLGIDKLKSRCLIKIGDDGKFEMHDQLRDLGRSIFCEGQPLDCRSGPWDDNYKGVPRVLREDDFGRRLHNLLAAASRGDKDLSEVRWLEWSIYKNDTSPWILRPASERGVPIAGDRHERQITRVQSTSSSEVILHESILTANLRLPKLVVLNLTSGEISEDWGGWSLFRASTRLRALDLFYCWNLRSTPDLSAFTQLKFLNLGQCSGLEHLCPSIGELKSLISLDLGHCIRLKELPEEVGELKDLEELDLRSSGIRRIPTSIGSLGKLKKLKASCCQSLREIPSSIGDLQDLQYLNIDSSGIEELPSAIGRLKNLQTLYVSCTPISDLPKSIRNLSSLQRLDVYCCEKLRSMPELPSSLVHLRVSDHSLRLPQLSSLIHLEELHLDECYIRTDIPDIASRLWKLDGLRYLESISITYYSSIEILDLSELVHLKRLSVQLCDNLVEIQGLDYLEFLEVISIWRCDSIKKLLCPESRCLKELQVFGNANLVEIQVPLDGVKFLEKLDITACESLETLSYLTGCEKLRSLFIRDCKKLTQIQGLENLDLIEWDISGCDSLEAIPKLSGQRISDFESDSY